MNNINNKYFIKILLLFQDDVGIERYLDTLKYVHVKKECLKGTLENFNYKSI